MACRQNRQRMVADQRRCHCRDFFGIQQRQQQRTQNQRQAEDEKTVVQTQRSFGASQVKSGSGLKSLMGL